ncbi:hypothetical protein [Mucilaginibacter segetis]|nr:hypothetical protein [Mucilaginibacter segetis]
MFLILCPYFTEIAALKVAKIKFLVTDQESIITLRKRGFDI